MRAPDSYLPLLLKGLLLSLFLGQVCRAQEITQHPADGTAAPSTSPGSATSPAPMNTGAPQPAPTTGTAPQPAPTTGTAPQPAPTTGTATTIGTTEPPTTGTGQTSPQPPVSPLLSSLYNGATVSFSFAQSISSNWLMSDENYLAVKLGIQARQQRNLGPFTLRGTLNVGLGVNYRDDSVPNRTFQANDNEIFAELMTIYPIRWIIDPYVSGNVRTAITESYRYLGRDYRRMASFRDPITTQQSAGFTYMRMGTDMYINTRVGLLLQQIRAHYQTMATDDLTTVKVVEQYKPISGLEFVSDVMLRSDTTLAFTSRFGVSTSFKDLSVWTVRWDNETRFQLWKSIGLIWTFNVVHDVAQTRKTQFKQAITLGLIGSF